MLGGMPRERGGAYRDDRTQPRDRPSRREVARKDEADDRCDRAPCLLGPAVAPRRRAHDRCDRAPVHRSAGLSHRFHLKQQAQRARHQQQHGRRRPEASAAVTDVRADILVRLTHPVGDELEYQDADDKEEGRIAKPADGRREYHGGGTYDGKTEGRKDGWIEAARHSVLPSFRPSILPSPSPSPYNDRSTHRRPGTITLPGQTLFTPGVI